MVVRGTISLGKALLGVLGEHTTKGLYVQSVVYLTIIAGQGVTGKDHKVLRCQVVVPIGDDVSRQGHLGVAHRLADIKVLDDLGEQERC